MKGQLAEIAPEADIHDLRIVPGPTHTNVIFDCAVPADWLAAKDHRANKIPAALHKAVSDRWPDHFCVIQLEPGFMQTEIKTKSMQEYEQRSNYHGLQCRCT